MSEPTEPVAPDPNAMPMDDLAKLIESIPLGEDTIPEAKPEAEPEGEAPETEEPAEKEPEPEKAPETTEEKAAETKADDLPEHVRLRLEATEAERKKYDAIIGKQGGELDFLRRKLRDLEQRLSAKPEETDTDVEPSDRPAPKPSPARDSLSAWAVAQACRQAAAEFGMQNPDAETMTAEIQAYLQKTGYNPASVLESNDPIEAAKEVHQILELAYRNVSADKKVAAAKEAEEQAERHRADEAAKLSARRRAVSATPTGGVRAAVKPKAEDPASMPLKDLKSLIERVGAGTE